MNGSEIVIHIPSSRGNMSVVVDDENRIFLSRELREKTGISKSDRLLAVPFGGAILLIPLKGKKFAGYLKDFIYDEEAHEASRYLL